MKKGQELLEKGSFWELAWKLMVPSVVTILVMILYNMADTFFIGQTGDPSKISSISLAMPVFAVLSGIGTLFGNGGSTSISIALGEGNISKVKQIVTFCFFDCLAVGLAFMAAVILGAGPLALALGADEYTLENTILYLRVFSLACPLIMLSHVFASLMRADGDAGIGMVINMSGTIANIFLDALFIMGFHWDVFGAAFASVLGNLLSAAIVVWLLIFRKPTLRPAPKCRFLDPLIAVPVLTLGLPQTFSTLLGSVSHALANRLMMSHGQIFLAAQSVSGKMNMLINMLVMGVCLGLQPAISYCYGARNYRRMNALVKKNLAFSMSLGIALVTIVFVFKDQLIRAFIDNAEVIEIGQVFVLAAVAVGPLTSVYQMCMAFLQATGKVKYSIFTSLLDKGLVYVPVLLVMNHFFGAYGIAFSHAVTMVGSVIVASALALRWSAEIKARAA